MDNTFVEEVSYIHGVGRSGVKFNNYFCTKNDKKILRELAAEKADIASLDINKEKIEMWKRLNDLKDVRPMVWITDIPWHEMSKDNELKLQTTTEFAQYLESNLKTTLYRYKHMKADMVVEPVISCYLEITNTGFGIEPIAEDTVITDERSSICSRRYAHQIETENDIDKIKIPQIRFYEKETEEKYQAMKEIFEGFLKVMKRGQPGFWFAPFDRIIRWWGVQELLSDMALRPALVHKTINKLTEASLVQLEQFEKLNLLASNNGNYRTGSGGLGYTDDLPSNFSACTKIKAKDLWGNAAAQIFSVVSPEMHNEFALQYEIKWLEKFGLTYYGCCDALDKKIDILRKIPNLRKISMSTWVNLESAAENIGRDYVFSYKPNPAIFAEDNWDTGFIRKKLIEDLNKIKKCNVEIIMKDISTVRYKPERLWEWAKIATDVVEKLS